MINFQKISDSSPVVEHLQRTIEAKLDAGLKIFWLLSGGSFMPIEVEVAQRLSDHPGLKHLSVTLTDERYGPDGHQDSNWQKLLDAGSWAKARELGQIRTEGKEYIVEDGDVIEFLHG